MCGYFCIGFIDFMLKSKSLIAYTNLFSPDKYEKNYKVIQEIMRNLFYEQNTTNCCIKCNKYRKFKNPKILWIYYKTEFFLLSVVKCSNNDEKIFKEE